MEETNIYNSLNTLTFTMNNFINLMDFNKDILNRLSFDKINIIIKDELNENHVLIKSFLSIAESLNLKLPNMNDYDLLDNVFLKINVLTLYNFRLEYIKVIKLIKEGKYIETFKQLEIASNQIIEKEDYDHYDDNESLS